MPIPVIMSMAGHISPKMTAHYTSISEHWKREAPQGKPPKRLHPNCTQIPKVPSCKPLKNMAGTTGLEPAASAVTEKPRVVIS